MRLGLIGDVHAEDVHLKLTLDALREARVERVLCTGDLVDGPGDVDRASALLREASALVVRGNHDRWIRADEMRRLPHAHAMTALAVDTIAQLKGLPPTASLALPGGGTLLLCHGVGPNDMQRLLPDDRGYALSTNDDLLAILFDPSVRVMVAGHTHRPMLRRFERGHGKPPLFAVNPGTLARDDEPGFAILEIADDGAGRVDFHRIGPDRTVMRTSSALL
ncbi:MAG: metallophosphoesterase family protein [Labilithrix sp.]|nr:metallophosphoesterase family protein [Labilithrix sp.]